MEVNYSLNKVTELASGDNDFIAAIAAAFLDEVPEAVSEIEVGINEGDFVKVYQNAHKIKPTIQLFDIPVFEELVMIQNWGKLEQKDKNIANEFKRLSAIIKTVTSELKSDFKL